MELTMAHAALTSTQMSTRAPYHTQHLFRQNKSLECKRMGACAGPTDFTTSLPFARTPRGRIAVDEHLRVLTHPHSEVGPAHPSEVRPNP